MGLLIYFRFMKYSDSNYPLFFEQMIEKYKPIEAVVRKEGHELLAAWNNYKIKGRILVLERPDYRGTGVTNGAKVKKHYAAFSIAERCDVKDNAAVDLLHAEFDADIDQVIAHLLENSGMPDSFFRTVEDSNDVMPTLPLNNLKLTAKRCEFYFYTPANFFKDDSKWH
jgi:hypothetical protein